MNNTNQTNIDFFKHLYHLRDFEIKNLWQRSIFLAGFIGLFFTGYGKTINKMLENNGDFIEWLNLIALAICLLGFVFSILWTMMAKGSKAWYEVYERKIELFEDDNNISKNYRYCIKNNENVKPKKMDSCLFSTNAGPFSVSKINILIGVLLIIIWTFLFIFHLIYLSCILYSSKCCDSIIFCIIILCLFAIGIYIGVYFLLTCSAKSSSLIRNQ